MRCYWLLVRTTGLDQVFHGSLRRNEDHPSGSPPPHSLPRPRGSLAPVHKVMMQVLGDRKPYRAPRAWACRATPRQGREGQGRHGAPNAVPLGRDSCSATNFAWSDGMAASWESQLLGVLHWEPYRSNHFSNDSY